MASRIMQRAMAAVSSLTSFFSLSEKNLGAVLSWVQVGKEFLDRLKTSFWSASLDRMGFWEIKLAGSRFLANFFKPSI